MPPPSRFRIVAGLFLVWTLIGVAAYLSQVTADLDALAQSDPSTARAFAEMPQWAWAAYAVAVWVGTAGSIALLMRRAIAVPLYAVSLAGVLAQFGWTFFGSDVIAEKGFGAAVFPLFIIAMGCAMLWYAVARKRDGTLR